MYKNPALESIQFQKSDLFNEITQCIKSMRNLKTVNRQGILEGPEINNLIGVISKHTGLGYTFVDNGYGFTAYTPILNQHIFDRNSDAGKFAQADQEVDYHYSVRKIMEAMKVDILQGEVSLKESKVTGFFCDLKCYMSIPRFMLNDKTWLDEELAAFVLHELGHTFTSFEYLSRTVTTNQALSLMQRTMDKTSSYEDRKIIIATATQAEKIKLDADAQKLLLGDVTPEMMTLIVINQQIEACKSELGASVYDLVSCEYLADQFAARHGAGRYLITALDKCATRGADVEVSGFYFRTGINMMLVGLGVAGMGLPVFGFAMGVFSLLLGTGKWAYDNSEFEMTHGYDNDLTRMNRIKHQMVERIKDPACPVEEKKFILSYIDEVEPVIKKYQGQNNPKLKDRIAFFFSKKHKYDFEFKAFQKDLEELGNNDLFIMSEKLKNL